MKPNPFLAWRLQAHAQTTYPKPGNDLICMPSRRVVLIMRNAKMSLRFIKHDTMETYGAVAVQFRSFLASEL